MFGLTLLFLCFFIDRRVREASYQLRFEMGKVSEKKSNLTSESFESVRAIKLYGWDGYFHKEILKYMEKERDMEEQSDAINKSLQVMWSFFPPLIAPVTFLVFLSSGKTMNYSGLMEAVMLLERIQGPLHHLNGIQNQIVDLRVCIRKIQAFLDQPESKLDERMARRRAAHPDHAIWIENQNYTWGVQTVDIDDMFDNMMREMKGQTKEE